MVHIQLNQFGGMVTFFVWRNVFVLTLQVANTLPVCFEEQQFQIQLNELLRENNYEVSPFRLGDGALLVENKVLYLDVNAEQGFSMVMNMWMKVLFLEEEMKLGFSKTITTVATEIFRNCLSKIFSWLRKIMRSRFEVEKNCGFEVLTFQSNLALNKVLGEVCNDKMVDVHEVVLMEIFNSNEMHHEADQNVFHEVEAAMEAGTLEFITNQVKEKIADVVQDGQQAL